MSLAASFSPSLRSGANDATRATNKLYALQKSCDCPIRREKWAVNEKQIKMHHSHYFQSPPSSWFFYFIFLVITEEPSNMSGQTQHSPVKTSNLPHKCPTTGAKFAGLYHWTLISECVKRVGVKITPVENTRQECLNVGSRIVNNAWFYTWSLRELE